MGNSCTTFDIKEYNIIKKEEEEEKKEEWYEKINENQRKKIRSLIPPSLIDYIRTHKKTKIGDRYTREGTILFIDISGFTKLTENLVAEEGEQGAEKLTQIINDYFGKLIKVIHDKGGTIEKYAGDAIITTFAEKTLKKAFEQTISCGATLVKKYGTVTIAEKQLCIHTAISGGTLEYVQIGGEKKQYKQLLVGKPLWELGTAVDAANNGEVVVCASLENMLTEEQKGKKVNEKGDILLNVNNVEDVNGTVERKIDEGMIEQLLPYLEPHIQQKIKAGTSILPEMKQIAMLFVHMPFELVQQESVVNYATLFQSIQRITQQYEGGISNILADEKGVHVLVSFGYPYQFEDVHYRAIKAAIDLRDYSVAKLYIGISYGLAYCGPVGNKERQDVTTMGDKINLAARLAITGKKNAWPIVVEQKTFEEAIKDIVDYVEEEPIEVKGKSDRIPILLPTSIKKKTLNMEIKNVSTLIERDEELKLLQESTRPRWISGEAGIGKTSLILKAYAEKKILVSIDATEKAIPFSSFKHCFDLLNLDHTQLETHLKTTTLQPYRSLLNPLLNTSFDETKQSSKVNGKTMIQQLYLLIKEIFEGFIQKEEVIVFDNTQWMDKQSSKLLEKLINEPLKNTLIVISSRDTPPCESPAFDHLSLSPLTEKGLETLILSSIPEAEVMNDDFLSFFIEKSKGNPQVARELLDLLQNHNMQTFHIIKNELLFTDAFKAKAATFNPPSKRSEFLLGKLDRQKPSAKLILKLLSIFQSPSVELNDLLWFVKEVSLDHVFDEALAYLDENQLIKRDETTLSVVNSELLSILYDSLPEALKGNYHLKLATFYANNNALKCSVRHYLKVIENRIFNQTTELQDVLPSLRTYIDHCKKNRMHHEMMRTTHAAFDLMKRLNLLDDKESVRWWHETPAATLFTLYSPEFVQFIIEHYTALLELQDDKKEQFKSTWVCWFQKYAFLKIDHLPLAESLLNLSTSIDEPLYSLQAHRSMALSLYLEGKIEAINEHVDKGIAIYSKDPSTFQQSDFGNSDPGLSLLVIASRINWLFGKYPQSNIYAKDALLSNDNVDDLYSKILYYSYTCYNLVIANKFDQLSHIVENALALYAKESMKTYGNYVYEMEGYSDFIKAMNADDPTVPLKSLLENIKAFETLYSITPYILYYCYMCVRIQHLGDSIEEVDSLLMRLSELAESSDVALSAEFHRLIADLSSKMVANNPTLYSKSKHLSKIESSLFSSIEIAKHENNFSFMLRSALNLMRIWEQRNLLKDRSKTAHTVLKDVHDHILHHHLDEEISKVEDKSEVLTELDDLRAIGEYYSQVTENLDEKDHFTDDLQNQLTKLKVFFPVIYKIVLRAAEKENATVIPLAVKTGDRIPHFEVTPYGEEPIEVYDYLKRGPLVINFFRGSWCKFCTAEMCNLDKEWSSIKGLGANILSISNHESAPSNFIKKKVKMSIAYDENLEIAKKFRIIHNQVIPNPSGPRTVAYPATYVVNQEGYITKHFVDARSWLRLHPKEILKHLRELQSKKIDERKKKDSSIVF